MGVKATACPAHAPPWAALPLSALPPLFACPLSSLLTPLKLPSLLKLPVLPSPSPLLILSTFPLSKPSLPSALASSDEPLSHPCVPPPVAAIPEPPPSGPPLHASSLSGRVHRPHACRALRAAMASALSPVAWYIKKSWVLVKPEDLTSGANRPVGSRPSFLRHGPQLQHDEQPGPQLPLHTGHTQAPVAAASMASSPWRLRKQGPQNVMGSLGLPYALTLHPGAVQLT